MKKCLSIIAGISSLLCCQAKGKPPEVGDAAPKVTAINQEGQAVDLGKAFESGLTLVYFYPKADTPGCTAQACSLRDSYAAIGERGITVYGVSMDSAKEQKAFQEKYDLPFILIADTDGKVVDAFGVPRRGKFPSRQAFLIEDGRIVWRDLSASTRKQADDVLTYVKQREASPEEAADK